MVAMFERRCGRCRPAAIARGSAQTAQRTVTEIVLTSLDEPGFEVTFTASRQVASANRVRGLLEDALAHFGSAEGQAGYVHPVIRVTAEILRPQSTDRTIYHFGYEVVDWLRDNGSLASKAGPQIGGPDGGAAAPWATEAAE